MPNIFGLGDKVYIDAELVKKLDCTWILFRMKLKLPPVSVS